MQRDMNLLRYLRVDDVYIQRKADRGLRVFAAEGLRRLRCLDILLVDIIRESQLEDFMTKLVTALQHFTELTEFALSKSLIAPGKKKFNTSLDVRNLVRFSLLWFRMHSHPSTFLREYYWLG